LQSGLSIGWFRILSRVRLPFRHLAAAGSTRVPAIMAPAGRAAKPSAESAGNGSGPNDSRPAVHHPEEADSILAAQVRVVTRRTPAVRSGGVKRIGFHSTRE
jgi:hypothetical protein